MDIRTAHKLLGSRGSHPTTPAGINKRLEAIAAGRGTRKPTAAHPYPACFGTRMHYHYGHRVTSTNGGKRYVEAYGPHRTCAEYIAHCEADRTSLGTAA